MMKETLIVLSVKKKKSPWIRGGKHCKMANTFESEICK